MLRAGLHSTSAHVFYRLSVRIQCPPVVCDFWATFKHGHMFYTTSGVRQGCILAPALFCCAIDWLMRHVLAVLESMLATFISPISTTLMTQSFLLMIQRNGTTFFEILRHQQPLWVSTQTAIKRRSKILELELLQEQSILTIKQ